MASSGRRAIKSATAAGALAFFMALASAPSAHALDWRLAPTLDGSATYTDNANHSEDDPEGAMILTATPGFTLRSEGSRRVQATLQYGLTGTLRFDEDDNTDVLHRLNATGNAELVEDFLFIDGSAHVSQELISLEGPLVEAEISDSNRATVGTYSVSPYIQKRLGTFANAEARYTASGAIFENDAAANSTVNAFMAALTSGTRYTDFSWGLNYSLRKAEYDDNFADTTFEDASATLGYALTRTFRIFGTVGDEWNDYLSLNDTDGSFYSAGFGWSPTRRTSLEVAAGERYFGNTWNASARHRTRASNWTLSYVEDIRDLTQVLVEEGTNYYYLCDGSFVTTPFLIPPLDTCLPDPVFAVSGFVPALRNGVFVYQTMSATVGWGTGKLTYSLNAFDSKQDYELSSLEERSQGVTAGVIYRLAVNTSANGSLGLTRYERSSGSPGRIFATAPNEDREDDIYRFIVGVNHRFDPDLSGTLTYQHQQRDSNVVNGDFAENRITGTVSMNF